MYISILNHIVDLNLFAQFLALRLLLYPVPLNNFNDSWNQCYISRPISKLYLLIFQSKFTIFHLKSKDLISLLFLV